MMNTKEEDLNNLLKSDQEGDGHKLNIADLGIKKADRLPVIDELISEQPSLALPEKSAKEIFKDWDESLRRKRLSAAQGSRV